MNLLWELARIGFVVAGCGLAVVGRHALEGPYAMLWAIAVSTWLVALLWISE